TERSFAHMYETGGMRRVHLRGRDNILKRLLVQGAAFNLSILLRKAFGGGKPRRLQGCCFPIFAAFWGRIRRATAIPKAIRRLCTAFFNKVLSTAASSVSSRI